VAFGVSYERRLIDPLGFVVFGQWGTVGQDLDDLDFSDLKYSVGVGLTVRLGGKALLDISFAWGDEGSQSYTTGNTNNAIGFGARAAGTVGLRGVF
jgi:outer membrane translocation and assembly module TamA